MYVSLTSSALSQVVYGAGFLDLRATRAEAPVRVKKKIVSFIVVENSRMVQYSISENFQEYGCIFSFEELNRGFYAVYSAHCLEGQIGFLVFEIHIFMLKILLHDGRIDISRFTWRCTNEKAVVGEQLGSCGAMRLLSIFKQYGGTENTKLEGFSVQTKEIKLKITLQYRLGLTPVTPQWTAPHHARLSAYAIASSPAEGEAYL
jgi:hypothetical protein